MTGAAEAVSLPPAEAIRYFAGQVDVGTDRWTDVWKAGHTRAFMVAGIQAEDVLATIRAARDKALRDGTTLAEFRRDLAPVLERTGWTARGKGYVAWRTRLIYETNLRSAYAAGQYEQQTDPDVLALVPIWRYRHSGAKDPRPEHVRWDGLTLRHDDPWWRSHYPPNGWGCGCWVEPLTERQAARGAGTAGRDAAGLSEAPEILRRQWTNPSTGQEEMVPLGIDPGWDYNVGAAWRSNRDLPEGGPPPPPDFIPAAPALPAAPAPRARPARPPAPPSGAGAAARVAAAARRAQDDADVVPVLPGTPEPPGVPIQPEAEARAGLLRVVAELLGAAEAERVAAMDLDALILLVSTLRRRTRRRPR